MDNSDQRKHVRLKHRAKIRLTIDGAVQVVDMRDFSESGLYLSCVEELVNVDEIVEVQTLEIEDAPVRKVRVVRVEPGQGFAAEFIMN